MRRRRERRVRRSHRMADDDHRVGERVERLDRLSSALLEPRRRIVEREIRGDGVVAARSQAADHLIPARALVPGTVDQGKAGQTVSTLVTGVPSASRATRPSDDTPERLAINRVGSMPTETKTEKPKKTTAQIAKAYFGAIAERDLDAAVALWKPGSRDHIHGIADMRSPGRDQGVLQLPVRRVPRLEVRDPRARGKRQERRLSLAGDRDVPRARPFPGPRPDRRARSRWRAATCSGSRTARSSRTTPTPTAR